MALDKEKIASAIKEGLGFGDKETPDQVSKIAEAIVTHLQTALVNFLPGTVTGDAPPSGGPLTNGAAQNGVIILSPPLLEALFYQALGTATPEIQGFATAFSVQIMTAMAEYSSGSVTGVCSNTPTSPGALTGSGQNGTMSGIDPGAMSQLMASSIKQSKSSPELDEMCNKLVETIESDAQILHPMGTVVGIVSAGGGPVTAGAALGGTIS